MVEGQTRLTTADGLSAPYGVRMLALEDAYLLTQQQDLDVFVISGSSDHGDAFKHERQDVSQEQA
jgi:hypothetical protein